MRVTVLCGAVVILLGLVQSGCATPPHKDATKKGAPTSSIDRLTAARTATEQKPNDPDAQYALGNALFDLNLYDEAAAAYQRCVQLDEKYAKAYTNLGLALRRMGQPQVAVGLYEKALALTPDDVETWKNLWALATELGDGARAEQALKRLVQLEPKNPEILAVQADYYRENGQFEAAMGFYATLVALDPKNLNFRYDLGVCAFKQERWEEAEQSWRIVLRQEPNFFPALQGLPVVYWKMKDYKRAWESVETARAKNASLDPAFVAELERDSGRTKP